MEASVPTRVVFVNARMHRIFFVLMIISLVLTLASFAFALLFGGGFWWGFLSGATGTIMILGLAELAGANDETLIPGKTDG